LSDSADIRFDHVTKCYPAGSLAGAGVKNLLLHLPTYLREARRRGSFRALDDVCFEVRPGECFGLIGRNGSGKSTALGLVAGVIGATAGTVEVSRRVSPLLELGAGFHPELSGRENVALNGVLLGLTRAEVLARFEEIAAFSELGEFIDRPIRTYSSGMVARLGFSVVVHLDPEILLVDEVLAVGDEAFQQKCLAKMEHFRSRGTTMVFVSHNLAAVERVCDRVAVLQAGRLVEIGPPGRAIPAYRKAVAAGRG
jgi:lipopolysaccharide transport system ATP-binding protein